MYADMKSVTLNSGRISRPAFVEGRGTAVRSIRCLDEELVLCHPILCPSCVCESPLTPTP
jgi:hypothetical protein